MKLLSQCLVLLVDDTETNLDILVATLGEDYDLAVAMDGPTALELARDQSPDLILLDVLMPGMDGYEVCRRLQAEAATTDIPVIFLTGSSDPMTIVKAMELKVADYICKPFKVDDLVRRVTKALLKHGWQPPEKEKTQAKDILTEK